MMQFRSIIQVVFALAVTAGALSAQSVPLDLRHALEIAASDNLELRAARQQRAIALAGIQIAKQIPNPTITFGATRDTPHETLSYDQPFEIAGQRSKRVAVAKEEQKSTDVDINVLERGIRHRTREAFFQAINARAQARQAKDAFDLASRLKDVAQQRFDAGDVAQLDVIETEVELARAAAEYDVTVQEQKSADAALAALLGRPVDVSLVLQGELKDLPHSESLPENTAKALSTSADVQKAAQDVATEEKRLVLVKAQRIPNIDLQVNGAFNNPPSYNAALGGQVAVVVPLFYHGQGEVAQSSARLEFLKLTLQSQKLNASVHVAVAYYDYVAKVNQAEQYARKILPQTEKLANMAEESYKAGKSNLLVVIDAQRKLNEIRRAYLDSLFAVQSAFAALEEAVGASLD